MIWWYKLYLCLLGHRIKCRVEQRNKTWTKQTVHASIQSPADNEPNAPQGSCQHQVNIPGSRDSTRIPTWPSLILSSHLFQGVHTQHGGVTKDEQCCLHQDCLPLSPTPICVLPQGGKHPPGHPNPAPHSNLGCSRGVWGKKCSRDIPLSERKRHTFGHHSQIC